MIIHKGRVTASDPVPWWFTASLCLAFAVLLLGLLLITLPSWAATTQTANKTEGTSLISLQSIAASSVFNSSSTAVSTKFGAVVQCWFARTTTTAPTVGVTYRVMAQGVSGGSVGFWTPIAQYTTGIAQVNGGNTIAISSTSSATLTVSSNGTSATAGQIAYAKDGTLANSEWFYVLSSTSTTVVAQQNFANSHTTGNVYNNAELISLPLDLSAVSHIMVQVDGSQHNQGFDTQCNMDTFDSTTSQ